MKNSERRNQEQALATAAASEQATANVGIVATAAEEIAQSIEHIAARVASSATVASQASGEAKAITEAVESLSASVDEIGEVSNLISSIAAQTNLLALNATIEADGERHARCLREHYRSVEQRNENRSGCGHGADRGGRVG